MLMKGYSTFLKFQDWTLTIRCSLILYTEQIDSSSQLSDDPPYNELDMAES